MNMTVKDARYLFAVSLERSMHAVADLIAHLVVKVIDAAGYWHVVHGNYRWLIADGIKPRLEKCYL